MITAKNYAAQAANGVLNAISKWGYSHKLKNDIPIIKAITTEMEKSVHFAVPDGGKIFDDKFNGLIGSKINMPFDSISIEFFYQMDGKTEKQVIYAKNIGEEIHLYSYIFVEDTWILTPLMASIDKNEPMRHDTAVKCTILGVLPVLCNIGISQGEKENLVRDLKCAMAVFLEFIEALSCTNVEATIHQAASPKNAQRIKSHKLPIYETKVLTIKAGSHTKTEGTRTGTHASPRQHLRRGHIRRLDSGNIWVNSCVVGAKENGVIDKSYKITV